AIAAQQTPEMAQEVATFAAAANLIATTVGTYLTLFISLPLAVYAYRIFEPILGRNRKPVVAEVDPEIAEEEAKFHTPNLGFGMRVGAWTLVGLMVLIGNRIGFDVPMMEALPGIVIIIVAVLVGDLIYYGTKRIL